MDCFSNLIGIKNGCGEVQQPTSGLWLDSLTGISIANADAAISAQYADGMDLILQKKEFAMSAVTAEVRNFLSQYTELKSIVDSGVLGHYKDDLPTVAAEADTLKGIQLDLSTYPYSSFNLTSVRLQLQTTGTVAVSVIDLTTNTTIDTFDVETVAGEISETLVNKTYQSWSKRLNLAIAYNSTGLASYKSTISPPGKRCQTCNGGWYKNTVYARGIYLRTANAYIQNNAKSLGHTAGLSITYNLSCDAEPFLCSLGNAMAWPILHKWAAEVVKEFQYSNRLNSIVVLDRNKHKELREEYENTYKTAMETLLATVRIPKDICFGCKPAIIKTVQIP